MTYLSLLRLHRVTPLVLAAVGSRLGVGLDPFAVVLFVHAHTGSYATAGIVAGALSLGMALAQPFLSRRVDVHGRTSLLPLAVVKVSSLATLIAAGHQGSHLLVLVGCALLVGGAQPPTSSVLRTAWPQLVGERRDLLSPAYALDAVLIQVSLVLGPLIVGLAVAFTVVDVAFVLSAVVTLASTAIFVALCPSSEAPAVGRRTILGPLTAPGIQTLVVTQVPIGMVFGSMQVTLPAFAEAEGQPEFAGLLLTLLSVASIVGALVCGIRLSHRPVHERHLLLAALLPVLLAPAALAWSIPAMCLLLLPAGGVLAAISATRNELSVNVAPPGTSTESVTWPLTALIAGNALGAGMAGALAGGAGWRWAVVAGVVVAGMGSGYAHLRRGTLAMA